MDTLCERQEFLPRYCMQAREIDRQREREREIEREREREREIQTERQTGKERFHTLEAISIIVPSSANCSD